MKQLTTYLPDETFETMQALAADSESINAYVRAAVEAENRRRMFAGMDSAIDVVTGSAAAAEAWHAANAEILHRRGDAA